MPTTAYRATLDAYDGSPARSWCGGENGWRVGIVEACSSGRASTQSSSATRFHPRGSFTDCTPPRAKLSREEPDAGNSHVRVCEGWGWQHPHLLGIRLGVAVPDTPRTPADRRERHDRRRTSGGWPGARRGASPETAGETDARAHAPA